jgi:hypothetical protein
MQAPFYVTKVKIHKTQNPLKLTAACLSWVHSGEASGTLLTGCGSARAVAARLANLAWLTWRPWASAWHTICSTNHPGRNLLSCHEHNSLANKQARWAHFNDCCSHVVYWQPMSTPASGGRRRGGGGEG